MRSLPTGISSPPLVGPHPFMLVGLMLLLLGAAQGQFYFGRNKIQYEQFDWQVLTTPHFQLFYYPEEENLARAAGFWAEEAFDELEQKFNHTLRRLVPLVIYSNHLHFQQTNTAPFMIPEGVGGFFEFVKGRVVLPNNGSMYDFRHVIRHELVHVFMYSKINAMAKLGGVLDPRLPPLWFIEGMAEWWSTGWDTEAEMVIRDALLHDHLLPLESLSLMSAGFLLYKEGQAFLRYFEETYGSDRIRQVMEEIYRHDSFEDALSAVTGKPYRELTLNWRLSLKQKAAAALSRQSLPGSHAEQLTRAGSNVAPTVYRDAEGQDHLVYLSSRDGYTNVYRQNLRGSQEELVIRGERTPNLESLHFLQSGLSVSGDGVLAFVAKSYQRDRIQLVDLENLEKVGGVAHPDLVTIRSPSWSKDGGRIIFSAQDQGGTSDLYLWTVGDSAVVRLTHDVYLDRDPTFSPDGRWVVFSSDRGRPRLDGGTNLFLLDLNSLELRMLTSGPYADRRPRWSPASPGAIHFVSDRSGTPNIWRLDLPGKGSGNLSEATLSPVTDLHTGAIDMLPLKGDSLLITAFQGYSFQLQLAKENFGLVSPAGKPGEPEPPAGVWTPPRYEGPSATESRPYRLKYSLDFAQTAVAYDPIFGFLGGAQLGISDVLGNRYYHFLIANTAQTSSQFLSRLNLAATTTNLTHRVNHAWGMFRFANEYFDPFQGFFFEEALGVRGAMNYPLSVFRRVELSGSLWRSRKEFFGKPDVEALLVSNYLSFVHDNSLWAPTGPVDGWRLRVTGGLTFNFTQSRNYNYTLLVDNRLYSRLTRRLTFAQRTMLWYNDGRDIRRFYIGGSWGLRGYRITQVAGRKYILLNHELRFPFARSLLLNLRDYAVGMAPIRGAFFLDVGNAWDREFPGFIGSYGFGLRGLFMGGLVMRWDLGKRTDFRSSDSPWFSQFFFGWDY